MGVTQRNITEMLNFDLMGFDAASISGWWSGTVVHDDCVIWLT